MSDGRRCGGDQRVQEHRGGNGVKERWYFFAKEASIKVAVAPQSMMPLTLDGFVGVGGGGNGTRECQMIVLVY